MVRRTTAISNSQPKDYPYRTASSRVCCIAWFSLFICYPRLWNTKVFADFLGEIVWDFTMPGHGRSPTAPQISPPRMIATFADQFAIMIHQVPNQIAALHG